jgi:hypothetical protein
MEESHALHQLEQHGKIGSVDFQEKNAGDAHQPLAGSPK